MAAQIPIKNDQLRMRARSRRCGRTSCARSMPGHDGTWVAHPGLVPIAKQIFDTHMKSRIRSAVPSRTLTSPRRTSLRSEGRDHRKRLRWNIDVGLQYLESWLRGSGCVPISKSNGRLLRRPRFAERRCGKWARHGATLSDGRRVTQDMVRNSIADERKLLKGARTPRRAPSSRAMITIRISRNS